MTDDGRNKLLSEVKYINEKLKEAEKNYKNINNTNIRKTNQLKKLMNERKEFRLSTDAEKLNNEIKRFKREMKNIMSLSDIQDIFEEHYKPDKNKSHYSKSFGKDGIHKDTGTKYDLSGFDKDGFDKNVKHEDTDEIYNPNGFDINGINKDTGKKYDPNGFDINGINKDTGTFLNKKNLFKDNINYNIYWLKNKYKFLKLFKEIIKKGEFTETANKKVISSNIFKDFVEDILSRKIKKYNKNEIYKERLDDVENDLTKSKKSKNVNQLKDYLTKIKDLMGIKDRIKVDEARSFKDQKGKGRVNLTIFLSKLYTNNNSKESINDIKQPVKNLYDNKQITEQVHNILSKAITYKNDS